MSGEMPVHAANKVIANDESIWWSSFKKTIYYFNNHFWYLEVEKKIRGWKWNSKLMLVPNLCRKLKPLIYLHCWSTERQQIDCILASNLQTNYRKLMFHTFQLLWTKLCFAKMFYIEIWRWMFWFFFSKLLIRRNSAMYGMTFF